MIEQNAIDPVSRPQSGMNELCEVYEDWLLVGAMQINKASLKRTCMVVQEQIDAETHQRLLLMELRPDAGGLKATLVLPAGLQFRKGVALQIDDGIRTPPLPFSTALPLGRFVDLDIDAARAVRLKSGKVLHIHAVAAGSEQPIIFNISLNGLAAALGRAEAIIN